MVRGGWYGVGGMGWMVWVGGLVGLSCEWVCFCIVHPLFLRVALEICTMGTALNQRLEFPAGWNAAACKLLWEAPPGARQETGSGGKQWSTVGADTS